MEASRNSKKDFTRERKLGFVDMVMFLLNLIKKTLQLELDHFMKERGKTIDGERMEYTKQAFSKARKKLSPEAFKILNIGLIKKYYAYDDYKKYKWYRLLAIDGTAVELPDIEELKEYYGYAEGGSNKVKVARGRASGLYDLKNGIMIDCELNRYDASERNLAKASIERLLALEQNNIKNLILFDRGYPSLDLILYLMSRRIDFLMRTEKVFLKEVNEAKGSDEIVEIELSKRRMKEVNVDNLGSWIKDKKTIKLRVIRVLLDSGEEEILISSILSPEMGVEDFKELYFERWGIETEYDELKNKLEIENFTGEKVIAVEQDFYATMVINNIASLIKEDAEELVQEDRKDKELKHTYQVNCNILVGKLKDNLIELLLEEDEKKRVKMYEQLVNSIKRNVVPIREGRSSPRKKGLKSNKYSRCRKRCL